MRKLYFSIFVLFLSSCLGYKELPVEYDYSYHGNFKKYRSFDIMRPIGMADTTMTNEVIEKSILSRMKFLGYKQNENKPHLIIGFKMFSDRCSWLHAYSPTRQLKFKTQTKYCSHVAKLPLTSWYRKMVFLLLPNKYSFYFR